MTDVNDNSPQWLDSTPTVVSLLEDRSTGAGTGGPPVSTGTGTRTGTPVISVTATDKDAGYNAAITYSLHAGRSITSHHHHHQLHHLNRQ